MDKAKITGTYIKSALSMHIGNSITPTPNIYYTKVKQGAVHPFFFISEVSVSDNPRLGNLSTMSYRMNIRYVEDRNEDNVVERLDDVGISLLSILKHLPVPIKTEVVHGNVEVVEWGTIRGYEIVKRVDDNECNVMVRYDITTDIKTISALMNTLQLDIDVEV